MRAGYPNRRPGKREAGWTKPMCEPTERIVTVPLIGRLTGSRDADIGEGARHGRFRPERLSGIYSMSETLAS